MGWTPDQKRAIEERDTNLLLSAAAGSGKTTVLVQRVLSLIEQGASVDKMLIVTFSRAAAADMKAKLTSRLAQRAQEDSRMAPQVEKVERASVCTIHSYCIDLLRGNFEAALVDPAFRVLDEGEKGQLQARALETTLEKALSGADEDLALLLFGREVKGLSKMVLSLYGFSQERPDPHGWLEETLLSPAQDGGEKWAQTLMHYVRMQVREALSMTKYALELANQGPKVYAAALSGDIENLEQIEAQPDYESLRESLKGYSQQKIGALRGEKDEYVLQLAQQVKDLREEQKNRMKKAAQVLLPLDGALADQKAQAPCFRALYRLVLAFEENLNALKQERSALTFGDLEQGALRALQDERVARAQRARFDYVFVDEYQDISDLQEAIIGKVAGENNLFMVGDVKQSIYRFRQAEPSLFIEKYLNYGKEQGGKLISLSRNFRSRARVLDLVNRVFEKTMSGPDAELQYDEAARLNPGREFGGEDPKIQVCLMETGENDQSDQSDQPEMTGVQAEGALVAQKIAALLGTPMVDGETGETRPIKPGDIAVLARTRAALTACELMLRNAGIPCYVDASDGYYQTLEVRVMLSLMQAVENRRRDFPLLAVLRSPIGGLTSTQLARIRAGHMEGPFYEAVEAWMEKDGPLADKLKALDQKLARWRMLSRVLPLGEWADRLLMESGYYAYVGGLPGGAARQGNLDMLCAYASQFESAQTGGLTGFLEYVEEISRTGNDSGAAHALGEGDDVVRLMTAHKSKGLEFPVVFAVQLGRSLAGKDNKQELCCHRQLGIGLYYNDPSLDTRRETLSRRAIRCIQQKEDLEEEKRILYVMLTRAQDRMILVGSVKSAESAGLRWQVMSAGLMRPQSYLDMIMPALDGSEEVSWQGRGAEETQEKSQPQEEPDEALVQRMAQALSWRYPYEGEELAPVKLTATGLTREITGPAYAPAPARRPRFLSRQGLTAAEKGTLLHAALSALDLSLLTGCDNLEKEISRQLKIMEEKNILSAPVNPAPLAAFFRRDVGKRLLAAKQVQREWPFNLRMTAREALGHESQGQVVVQGVLDCCFMEDGQWVLLDYKTDRVEDEELMARYQGQVALYARALSSITGMKVKQIYLCLMSMGRELEILANL